MDHDQILPRIGYSIGKHCHTRWVMFIWGSPRVGHFKEPTAQTAVWNLSTVCNTSLSIVLQQPVWSVPGLRRGSAEKPVFASNSDESWCKAEGLDQNPHPIWWCLVASLLEFTPHPPPDPQPASSAEMPCVWRAACRTSRFGLVDGTSRPDLTAPAFTKVSAKSLLGRSRTWTVAEMLQNTWSEKRV